MPVMENHVPVPRDALKTQKCVTLTADAFFVNKRHLSSPAAETHASLPCRQIFRELHRNAAVLITHQGDIVSQEQGFYSLTLASGSKV